VRWASRAPRGGKAHSRASWTLLSAQEYGPDVVYMSNGALLFDNTAIITDTNRATVRTDPWRAVQLHCALLRRVGDAGAGPLWFRSGAARRTRYGCLLLIGSRRWFSVRAVPWHAFCGGAWPCLVVWSGQQYHRARGAAGCSAHAWGRHRRFALALGHLGAQLIFGFIRRQPSPLESQG
jgi:hypothetical protein